MGHVAGMAEVFRTKRIYVWKLERSNYCGKLRENWRIKLKQASKRERLGGVDRIK